MISPMQSSLVQNISHREGAPEMAALSHALVMMIDDEPIVTEVVQSFLEDGGFSNFIAIHDPMQAISTLRRHRPDVVLLDLLMPGMSGFDLLSIIRSDEQLRYLPVIVLTAANDSPTKLRALELGATDFLAKPVDQSELTLRLRNTLAFKAYQDRLALYDAVTGLPNGKSFAHRLRQTLDHRGEEMVAILHIEVSRIREISDTLGLRAGDLLLRTYASRLENELRSGDTLGHGSGTSRFSVARASGEAFNVLLPNVSSSDIAATVARRLIEVLAEPIMIEGTEFYGAPNIGLAVSPGDGTEVDMLLRHAAAAVSQARRRGPRSYAFYSEETNARSLEVLTLENQLRRAIERDELVLHYQPKVDLATNRITGVEALLRWQHPQLGLVPPVKFIPVAEQCGLIVEIGAWVLDAACAQLRAWDQAGYHELAMSVNVAPLQFQRPGFIQTVESAIRGLRLPARRLVLELTESTLLRSADDSVRLLESIRVLGARLALDDFGTGYSSLTYLNRFPMDEIKLDRSFIVGLPSDIGSRAIIAAVVSLARCFGLQVTAEGAETDAQLAALRDLHCDSYQGFVFSRPVPAARLEELLAATQTKA
jgi:diguanylate cyclase